MKGDRYFALEHYFCIMPQGGSGKQGGNLMSSGNSKKRMSSKPRYSKRKTKISTGVDAPSIGHVVFQPNAERRAQVLRAQRAVLEAESVKRLAAKNIQNRNGHRLGGSGEEDEVVDVRSARLRFLERQQPQRSAASAPTSSPMVGDDDALCADRALRRAFEGAHSDDLMSMEVLLLLDLAAERLASPALMQQAHAMLCTVLRNAATKGGPGGDAKYRTLRASNEKLWCGLLRHRELVAVLCAAGFEPITAPQREAAAREAAPGTREPQVASPASSSVHADVDTAMQAQDLRLALAAQLDCAEPSDPAAVALLVAQLE